MRVTGVPVGIAVVGVGGIGRHHARTLAGRVAGCQVKVVVDAVSSPARQLGEELGVRWSTSYERALRAPDVAAVVLATPTPLHAPMIEQAAAAAKHVFCEKPIALDLAQARAALATARAAGILLQIGFQRRFDPDWLALREWLERGSLGEPRLLRISHRNRQPPRGVAAVARLGDLFADMTVHDLEASVWLLGEVETVFALGGSKTGDADDLRDAVVALRFARGCLGLIDNTRAAGYGFECSAELVGSRAAARIGAGHRRRDAELLTPDGSRFERARDHLERHAFAYEAELQHFVDAIRSSAQLDVTGIAAIELVVAARTSARTGRPVTLSEVG